MIMLQAKKLTKIYDGTDSANSTKALNGVDISIEKGEFVGVMGPSGSGKTTLLNILSGIDGATSGGVEISGMPMDSLGRDELALFRRRKLGFVFQDFNLLDSLTIRENIMLPMILEGRKPEEMERRFNEIANLFDIRDIADKYPCNTSGGQQQRAAVGRALANNPDIIFADEPTGNLDSKSSRTIMECFEKANAAAEATILMVTHDPFAASYCKRILFIKDGKVNMEIVRRSDRREFFDRILDCLAAMGGGRNDI